MNYAKIWGLTLSTQINKLLPRIEQIYKDFYPRKEGKSLGLRRLGKKIKTEKQLEAFTKAVCNYAAHVRKQQTETKYIKHFSTFSNCYEDYIDFSESDSFDEFLKNNAGKVNE